MRYTIQVLPRDTDELRSEYGVTLNEDGMERTYTVYLSHEYYERLTDSIITPETLIMATFAFLLKREPSTEILEEFDLEDVSRYFPEYEEEIHKIVRSERKRVGDDD